MRRKVTIIDDSVVTRNYRAMVKIRDSVDNDTKHRIDAARLIWIMYSTCKNYQTESATNDIDPGNGKDPLEVLRSLKLKGA